jgi:hypothetical protein
MSVMNQMQRIVDQMEVKTISERSHEDSSSMPSSKVDTPQQHNHYHSISTNQNQDSNRGSNVMDYQIGGFGDNNQPKKQI